jgi:hypothetical protein
MGIQSTHKKRTFLLAYKASGDVPSAAKEAGYTQAGTGYKYLRRDEQGRYKDPIARQILGEPAEKSAPVLKFVKGGKVDETPALTLDAVRAQLYQIARDELVPASSRVQALSVLLKDLKESQEPEEQSAEEVIEAIRQALHIDTR